MPRPTSDAERAWVRCTVPARVRRNALRAAQRARLALPFFYRCVLTRALWDVDPIAYADELLAQLEYREKGVE